MVRRVKLSNFEVVRRVKLSNFEVVRRVNFSNFEVVRRVKCGKTLLINQGFALKREKICESISFRFTIDDKFIV